MQSRGHLRRSPWKPEGKDLTRMMASLFMMLRNLLSTTSRLHGRAGYLPLGVRLLTTRPSMMTMMSTTLGRCSPLKQGSLVSTSFAAENRPLGERRSFGTKVREVEAMCGSSYQVHGPTVEVTFADGKSSKL